MGLSIISGNIFTSKCQTIVNTVNCVGVMGAGIALECRLRYPEMFTQYARLCDEKKIDVGILWLFKSPNRWVLNFPTKKHWKYPSKEQYLHAGLQKFMDTYESKNIESIAFPLLGAQHGGLDASQSLKLMESYLQHCSIPVEIYRYDPTAADDVYDEFKASFLSMTVDELKARTGLRSNYIDRIQEALTSSKIHQLNQLASMDGIGDKTLEKAFKFVRNKTAASLPAYQQDLGL